MGSNALDRKTVSTSVQPLLGNQYCSPVEGAMPLNMHRSTCLKVFIERRGRKNLTSDARATVPCSCTIGGVCRQLRPLPMLSHLRAPGRRPCMPDAARSQRPKLLDEVDKRLHLPSDSRHMGAYPADHYHILILPIRRTKSPKAEFLGGLSLESTAL